MSRKNQKLINYHSSGTSLANPIDVDNLSYGEIAVRHNIVEPELYIKVKSGSTDVIAVFWDSGKTQIMIDSSVSNISESAETLNNKIGNLSGEVIGNRATRTEVSGATGNAYTEATGYTNTVSGRIKNALTGYATTGTVHDINQSAVTINGKVLDLSGEVIGNRATKDEVTGATGNAYTEATGYTNTVSGRIKNALTGYATTGTVHDINQSAVTINGKVLDLSGATMQLSGGVKNYIDSKLSNVYVYKGSVDYYSNLSAFTGTVRTGDVYNVINANGNIPEGTNYAWNGTTWDALGGTVDLSNYATTGTVHDINQSAVTINGKVLDLSGEVIGNRATRTEVSGATGNAYTKATGYTNTVSGYIKNALTGYATTGTVHDINQSAVTINGKVLDLSGATQAIEATANSALQTFQLGTVSTGTATSNQSGAYSKTQGTTVTLDLSNLIIDCGDF